MYTQICKYTTLIQRRRTVNGPNDGSASHPCRLSSFSLTEPFTGVHWRYAPSFPVRINESPGKFFHFSHHNESEELEQRISNMGKEYEEMLNRRKELRKRPIIPAVSTAVEPRAQPKMDDIVSVQAKLNENMSKMMSKIEFRQSNPPSPVSDRRNTNFRITTFIK